MISSIYVITKEQNFQGKTVTAGAIIVYAKMLRKSGVIKTGSKEKIYI